MCAQPSNRAALLEGALSCLAQLPVDQISARAVARQSGANLASIGYHFGSKDELMSAAVVEGLDRWLESIGDGLSAVDGEAPSAERFRQAAQAVEATRAENEDLARAFVVALGRGLHDPVVADRLAEGFAATRPRVAQLLGLGSDAAGIDAGGLVHAMFTGLLVQSLLSEELVFDPTRILAALGRVSEAIT
ncbi:TetR/AcrR family transcriptional regulator [Kribbella catacumbae]|uniref:TetR/AcrR family transcriptional regulator n=1 Tax=Kribbella catacumbae TaxID=460086 RepID=UPI0009FE558A|nr:TetR/AcrR family transcriptional regulator [Kribbella catacumbae]